MTRRNSRAFLPFPELLLVYLTPSPLQSDLKPPYDHDSLDNGTLIGVFGLSMSKSVSNSTDLTMENVPYKDSFFDR